MSTHTYDTFALKIDTNPQKLDSLRDAYGSLNDVMGFRKKYGDIADLLHVTEDLALLKAAMEFYDPSVRGFVFKDTILVPTIEEYRTLLRQPTQYENAIIPSFLDLDAFRQLSKITGIPKKRVESWGVTRGLTRGIDWAYIKRFVFDQGVLHQRHRSNFVALGFFALILFPSARDVADESVLAAFGMRETCNWDPIPAILAETFRALDHCKKNGEGRLLCCTQLLHVWLITHLPLAYKVGERFESPTFENPWPLREFRNITWPKGKLASEWLALLRTVDSGNMIRTPRYFAPSSYTWKTWENHFVPLIGIRGSTAYAPVLAFRQYQDAFTPFNIDGLENEDFNFEGSPQSREKYTLTVRKWEARKIKTVDKAFNDQSPQYLNWHKSKFGVFTHEAETSTRKRAPSQNLDRGKHPVVYNWELEEAKHQNVELEKKLTTMAEELEVVKAYARHKVEKLQISRAEVQTLTERNEHMASEKGKEIQADKTSAQRVMKLRKQVVQLQQEKIKMVSEHRGAMRAAQEIYDNVVQKLKEEKETLQEKAADQKIQLNDLHLENVRLGIQNEELWGILERDEMVVQQDYAILREKYSRLFTRVEKAEFKLREVLPKIMRVRAKAAHLAKSWFPTMTSPWEKFAVEVDKDLEAFRVDEDFVKK